MKMIALLALGLSVAGCAAVPQYEPLTGTTGIKPGPFVTQVSGIADAANPADRWWTLYDDPALNALIEQALVSNTDLRVASANLRRAYAFLSESKAGRWPSTDLTAGAAYGDSTAVTGGASNATQWGYSAGLGLAWEADLFGRVTKSIRAARGDAAAVQAVRDAVALTVAAETARSYINACTLGEAVLVARQSVTIAQRGFDIVALQERAGSASQLDVDRAATALANAEAALPLVEGQRRAALFELTALLGQGPSSIPQSAEQCVKAPAPQALIPLGDGQALLARRPDVREAEFKLSADVSRIGVAVADLYPRISFGAGGSFLRNDDIKGSQSFSFSVGPLLSWSFPNLAVARARVRQAQAQADASLAAFDGVIVNALKEVEQALVRYEAQNRRHLALAEAVSRADNAHKLADKSYRAGALSFLETLDAQRSLLDARAAYAASDQQLGSARVDLFKALGGGWRLEPVTDGS